MGDRFSSSPDPGVARAADAEEAKLMVLGLIGGLVAANCAECDQLVSGERLLSLSTGEKFLLTDRMIVAIA
jgi:hypothetical protein